MKSFSILFLAVTFTSAYPTFAPFPSQPPPAPTPTPTNACPTTCPTSTSTIHPGYRCDPSAADPSEILQCPVAQCLSQPVSTTTITVVVPCSTKIITTTGGCTVPQSCVGRIVPTITMEGGLEGGFGCPTDCPELCPRSDVTERRLIGGGCARTA